MKKKQLSETMSWLSKQRHKKMTPEEASIMGKKMAEAKRRKLSPSKGKTILP